MIKINPLDLLYLDLDSVVVTKALEGYEASLVNLEGEVSLEYLELGIELGFNIERNITASKIFLYSGDTNFSQFIGRIPEDLCFSYSKDLVHTKLGLPNKSSGKVDVMILGQVSARDSYYFDNYTLRILYSEKLDSIERITLMTPEATPGREDE